MGEITYASGSLESLKALNLASIRSFTRIESFGDDEFPRPYSPSTPISSFNSVTFRQKGVRTKPRGFDEETTCSFNRWLQLDVQMDETIWQNLPEDLIVLILSRVPPFYLFRLRAVCTRWNFILQDKSFLAYHSQAPSHGPCLLTFSRNSQGSHCSAFSIPLKAWHRIPINFLPKWASWLVGSSGGLLCFAGWDGICFKILVCNPLTQKWKTLPMMHHNQQRLLILVTDRQNKFFKIIAANEACGVVPLPTEVYDSRCNSWTIHDSLPAVNVCSSKMVSSDSKIYLETLSPLGLMKFDMEKGRWEQIRAKFPRSLLDGYLVAGAKNRLFLVGRIGLYSTHQRVRIWELDHVKTAWVEIGKMPKRIFVSLRLSAERFDCAGQDNMICFTAVNPGKCLLYDVDKKTWSWISGCALHSLNSQSTFYEPRFDSSIH